MTYDPIFSFLIHTQKVVGSPVYRQTAFLAWQIICNNTCRKTLSMLVPLIALAVVIVGVVIYLVLQAGKKTRDQGNK